MEVEEGVTRRPSLQAAGGAAKEQEEEVKLREEGGSADSEQGTTETDGEEGILNKSEHCERPQMWPKYVSCHRTGTLRCSGEWPPCAVTSFSAPRHPPIPAGGRASSA